MPLMHTSPSPCAACASPAEKSAPMRQHGKIQDRAGTKLANVHISAKDPRWSGAKLPRFAGSDPHHSAERAQRHHRRRERPAHFALEMPMKERCLLEALFQKTKTGNRARPTPTLMFNFQHLNRESIPRLCAMDRNWTGEGMDLAAIDRQEVFDRRTGPHLASARVDALHVNEVARVNGQTRREGIVPSRVRRLCG